MVCRNPKFAEEAQKEIQDSSNNSNIHVHILDMSDPKAVKSFAEGTIDFVTIQLLSLY